MPGLLRIDCEYCQRCPAAEHREGGSLDPLGPSEVPDDPADDVAYIHAALQLVLAEKPKQESQRTPGHHWSRNPTLHPIRFRAIQRFLSRELPGHNVPNA